jgi:mannose-6-phosphate isomerase
MLMRLRERRVFKPWGRTDIPEQFGGASGERLGEIWFQREDRGTDDPLLVKYLFTSERLSVQVHPDDAAARHAGHPRGKDEAWVVLDAEPGASIGIGLSRPVSPEELRAAALDGSVVDLLDWRQVEEGDAFYSPAGTIHSIGAGLTLLEVQQDCDVTYRLYDFGRPRELHLDEAVTAARTDSAVGRSVEVTAARTDSAVGRSVERTVGEGRSIAAQGPKFILERWRSSVGRLDASEAGPMWLITVRGTVYANRTALPAASVWIADEPIALEIDDGGELLVAYEGSAVRAGS